PGFEIKKSGDASVALVGFPSVGKSSLISQLTDVESDTGNFEFTTLTCIPGVLHHRGATIQILDLPGLIKGASEGKGRGREILNVIRSCDMVLYVVDPFQESHFDILDFELWKAGMRLNQPKPQVFIDRTERGGVVVRSTLEQTNLTDEEIQAIIRSFGIVSANVTLRTDVTDDNIVDTLAGNRIYSDAVIVLNKIDLATKKDLKKANNMLPKDWPILPVSAKTGEGIEEMKDFIFNNLHFMSIYLKPQGQEADLIEPLIIKDTSTVRNVCQKLHRDFVRKFRYARVKGPSAKFDWQRVGLDHRLKDGDLLSIIVRR
ncbi:MAG TPA: GTPase, partial [Candidatus Thalassarchaeaceae archaeon]|nr:GTPase [Candidatus Thalassarchaeaceae archaeon]